MNDLHLIKLKEYETLQTLFNTIALPPFCFKFNHINCMVLGGSKFEKLGVDKERF